MRMSLPIQYMSKESLQKSGEPYLKEQCNGHLLSLQDCHESEADCQSRAPQFRARLLEVVKLE
jgi:hypothetical protein